MITKIVGCIWIVFGFLGVIWPDSLKRRLEKKLSKRIKRLVILCLMVLGFMLAGSIFKANNFTTLLAGIIGAVLVIKLILMITNKTSEKFFLWLKDRSVKFFRIWAFLFLLFGIFLFLG